MGAPTPGMRATDHEFVAVVFDIFAFEPTVGVQITSIFAFLLGTGGALTAVTLMSLSHSGFALDTTYFLVPLISQVVTWTACC